MPELPEVEVVRTVLDLQLKNKKIIQVECFYDPIIEGSVKEFQLKVEQKKIIEIQRYAKYLIFILEDGAFLSHLRMEGKYYYLEKLEPHLKYVHILFHFEDGSYLAYSDMRKFGRIVYKKKENLYTTLPLSKIGLEANQALPYLETIYHLIHQHKVSIKSLLLNQEVISGLGNIYVDEVLYASRIKPTRLSNRITKKEVYKILLESQRILNEAIRMKGTTIRSYTSSLNVMGEYQNQLKVHTKTNCSCCGNPIRKIKIGGRGTYYCPHCQR